MTDLEDRLRAELAAFAQRADPALIRPLREPAIPARPPGQLPGCRAITSPWTDPGLGISPGPWCTVRPRARRWPARGSPCWTVSRRRSPGRRTAGRSSLWTTPARRLGTGMASGSTGSGLHSPPRPQRDGYRLLNVAGPGGDLLPAGAVVPVSPNPGGDIPPALLTPDGRAFITSSTRIVPGRDHHVTVTAKIIKLSARTARTARTGRAQRVLYAASARGVPQKYGNTGTLDEQGCTVLSLDPTGQHPLVRCFLLGRFSFGTLASGRLKPLPGIPNIYCVRECRGPMWGTAAW